MTARLAGDCPVTLDHTLERHRAELTAHCRRMLGPSEADDAAQEALVRAWRGFDRFEGRAALRTWLYRIAANVCFEMLTASQRRAVPVELMPSDGGGHVSGEWREIRSMTWITSAATQPAEDDPGETTIMREAVRVAFAATVQRLPPRQRAVLILREVFRWRAAEVAEHLQTTVASVNSALQRARATLAVDAAPPDDGTKRELVARAVEAFERYDVESLASLLDGDLACTP